MGSEKPINLFQLGCLFVIRASYWSCRIGNEPQDFHLSPHEVESKAIASFGSKELIDPDKGRKVFQQIEKRARHQLGKYSRPFPAANAHFVPWDHVPELIDQLQALKAEFDQAVEGFLAQYPATAGRVADPTSGGARCGVPGRLGLAEEVQPRLAHVQGRRRRQRDGDR